jgi:hypothetical protein
VDSGLRVTIPLFSTGKILRSLLRFRFPGRRPPTTRRGEREKRDWGVNWLHDKHVTNSLKRLILFAVLNDLSPILARVFSITTDDREITDLHNAFLSMLG